MRENELATGTDKKKFGHQKSELVASAKENSRCKNPERKAKGTKKKAQQKG